MLKKGSKLYSILTGTCPKCHGDKMFVNKNPFALADNLKMHHHCTQCGFVYKIETSFFFGAMYVSYGLGVLLGMLIFGLAYAAGATMLQAFAWIFILEILLMPIITRLSRNIYINMFVNYDPNAVSRYKENA